MRRLWSLPLAISVLVGCAAEPIEPTVILISIDSFRPDYFEIADEGWTILSREIAARLAHLFEGGAQGYDNTLASMQAIFVAHGPAFKKGAVVESFSNIHVYSLLTHM